MKKEANVGRECEQFNTCKKKEDAIVTRVDWPGDRSALGRGVLKKNRTKRKNLEDEGKRAKALIMLSLETKKKA